MRNAVLVIFFPFSLIFHQKYLKNIENIFFEKNVKIKKNDFSIFGGMF